MNTFHQKKFEIGLCLAVSKILEPLYADWLLTNFIFSERSQVRETVGQNINLDKIQDKNQSFVRGEIKTDVFET